MTAFNWKWEIKNGYPAPGIEKHGKKVFSTFACGGGSTMGYKLAGFEVIGANDIDPQMAKVYKGNHHPKHYFLNPIGDLLTMDLPDDLYDLDILDGSPPCSTFSMAGSREKGWKKNKKFREGQSEQVLSDLFFDWIKLVQRLQPKIAVAENVKGMLKPIPLRSYESLILSAMMYSSLCSMPPLWEYHRRANVSFLSVVAKTSSYLLSGFPLLKIRYFSET